MKYVVKFVFPVVGMFKPRTIVVAQLPILGFSKLGTVDHICPRRDFLRPAKQLLTFEVLFIKGSGSLLYSETNDLGDCASAFINGPFCF